MKHETNENAKATARFVKARLREVAKAHPRAEYARRSYSAKARKGHGLGVANVFCFHERECAKIAKAIKNAVGNCAKVAPGAESIGGETGDALFPSTFAPPISCAARP